MGGKNTVSRALIVTVIMSVIASVVVSFSAVSLKELQDSNKVFDKQRNILEVTGLIESDQVITKTEASDLYENIITHLVDLKTGAKVEGDASDYDLKKASKDPSLSEVVPSDQDIASIKRQEKLGVVYEVMQDGQLETLVLPIRGYGLWSTLWGFLAVSPDGKTVKGITYYEHAETPGLGGEVDNPRWKSLWVGKKIFDNQGQVALRVIKGSASTDSPHDIDGLSGATLTANGVDNMIRYWLSDRGYGKVLKENYFQE